MLRSLTFTESLTGAQMDLCFRWDPYIGHKVLHVRKSRDKSSFGDLTVMSIPCCSHRESQLVSSHTPDKLLACAVLAQHQPSIRQTAVLTGITCDASSQRSRTTDGAATACIILPHASPGDCGAIQSQPLNKGFSPGTLH